MSTSRSMNARRNHEEEDIAVPYSVTEALHNDLVLDAIFSYLTVPDLKVCRQVCRQWKQASRRSLVEQCNGVGFLADNRNPVAVVSTDFKRVYGIGGMAQLTDVINSSTSLDFPCAKFLVDADIKSEPESHEEILQDFLRAIGPLATELQIRNMDTIPLFELENPNNVAVTFPRLKALQVGAWYFSEDYSEDSSTVIQSNLSLCQNILMHAPQLTTFDIHVVDHGTMLDLIIDMINCVVPLIRNLHLRASLHDGHLDRLCGINLKLDKLWLFLDSHSRLTKDGEACRKFLESQSDSLKELHVGCAKHGLVQKTTIRFPRMRKLKRLTLSVFPAHHKTISFSDVNFAEQFPVLKQLDLWDYRNDRVEVLLNSNAQPLDTLESLKLPEDMGKSNWICKAARTFPNVKKLKIPARKWVVQGAFQAWQNVEELTIANVRCGRSANELLMASFGNNLVSNSCSKSGVGVKSVKFLQDLEILRLQGFHHKDTPTDLACRVVLMKMSSLKCLDLSKCSRLQISERVLKEMRLKFVVLCGAEE